VPADLATIALAQQVCDHLQVRPDHLQAVLAVPTLEDYLPVVEAASTPSMLRAYRSYWRRAGVYFAGRTLDSIRASEIEALKQRVVASARTRRTSRGGRYAGENLVRAMRRVYRLAIADDLIAKEHNPAARVPLPRRLPSTRRALSSRELTQIQQTAIRTSQDPVLDSLILRLHTETACRRGGALALRLRDLDTTYCRILLREKFGTHRWQPISPTLAQHLHTHAVARGAQHADDSLLRYANHSPITSRRYDLLWKRVRHHLPWAAQQGVSTHWLRHTTLTWVERHHSYAVARAYAGHTDHKRGVTLSYVKGLPRETARALSALTGEPHPLSEVDATTPGMHDYF
jgi:site-specific recombinase XerD